MKTLAATLFAIPILAFGGEAGQWSEVFDEEIEGIRKFEIFFESPRRVKIELSTTGQTQVLRVPTLEKGFTLTVIAPEVYGVDAHLTAKLKGHSTCKVYTMATVNDPTNLRHCEPDLSQSFELEAGRYILSVSEDFDSTVRSKLSRKPSGKNRAEQGGDGKPDTGAR